MRNLIWAALAVGFMATSVGGAAAQDTIRLGGPSAQAAIQGGIDTELVRWRHHGYYRSYYRPYYAGYYGRPYYYPRSYVYYAPAYYPSYYSYYEYNRPAYYPSSYYYPIAGEALAPPATNLQAPSYYRAPAPQQYVPPMPPANGSGTFPYDGGPRSPVPMPNPEQAPRGIIPIDGRLVSLPTEISGGTTQVGAPASPRNTVQPRVTYPAYGEEPIVPAPRKTGR